jgi:hypothetical protein
MATTNGGDPPERGPTEKGPPIQPPRISAGMREYRRTCGFHLLPDLQRRALSDRASWVYKTLFHVDPYRPIGPWLLDAIRHHRPMSKPMFDRCIAELRDKGLIEGDQPPKSLLDDWEAQWRKARRDGVHWQITPDRAEGQEP